MNLIYRNYALEGICNSTRRLLSYERFSVKYACATIIPFPANHPNWWCPKHSLGTSIDVPDVTDRSRSPVVGRVDIADIWNGTVHGRLCALAPMNTVAIAIDQRWRRQCSLAKFTVWKMVYFYPAPKDVGSKGNDTAKRFVKYLPRRQ